MSPDLLQRNWSGVYEYLRQDVPIQDIKIVDGSPVWGSRVLYTYRDARTGEFIDTPQSCIRESWIQLVQDGWWRLKIDPLLKVSEGL